MSAFWSNKKVFITGHTGFKGAWLTETLVGLGADVTGYSLPAPSSPALFDLLDLKSRINHIDGDVRDRIHVIEAIKEAQPHIILHMAAQALVRKSYQEPVETFDTNMMGTVNVLEGARHAKNLRSIVVVTTDKCYLNEDKGIFFKENDKLGGKDPYSASKAAAEIVSQAYYESFFKDTQTALATARAGNVIGGGDWALDRLIPDTFRAYTAGEPVVIRYPAATRPWQHVLEPIRGYMMLAERLYNEGHAFASGWNFGPQESGIQSVGHVLTTLQKSYPFELKIDQGPQLHEAKTLGLNIEKAISSLKWKPLLDLEQSIQWTGEWYKAFADKKSPLDTTREQISRYFGLA